MNRSKFALTGIACVLSTSAACLGQVSTPVLGVGRLSDGTLRILYGVPDNVIVDPQSLGRFDTASFSDDTGLISRQGSIELVDRQQRPVGEYQGDTANALLNIDGGPDTAMAWLPASQVLVHWDGKSFQATATHGLPAPFKVTSLRRNGSNAEVLISDPNGFVLQGSVSIETGEFTSLTPLNGIHAPAFWAGDRILFTDASGLALQEPNGTVADVAAIGGNLSFARISSDWVLVTSETTHRSWALNVSVPHVRISEIPAALLAPQEGAR